MPTELIAYQLIRFTGSVDGQPIEQTKAFTPTFEAYLELMELLKVWAKEAGAARESGKAYPSGPYEHHLFGQTAAKETGDAGAPKPNPQYQHRRRES